MSDSLIDTAPGFNQPIAVLKHCHDRIRKQLRTLQKLQPHLIEHGADAEAQQAAQAVLKYFDRAAHWHHADEEDNLIPMLQATARDADAALLAALVPEILADHQRMDADWLIIKSQLDSIVNGLDGTLPETVVARFCDAYAAHMEKEEAHVAPMAKRLFSAAQMAELGEAMQRRRGLAADAAPDSACGTACGTPATAAMTTASAAAVTAPSASGEALAGLRRDYGQASLSEADVLADPIAQFAKWFDEAVQAQVNEPNAMSVATVAADGKPTSRIVLIKQYDARGFTWYTNYESQKGQQLRANPHAALLFFWSEVERQVRIEGTVEKTSAEESDKYFYSRPLKSRLAAIASRQSEAIAGRAQMETNYTAAAAAGGDAPQRPEHWGGYRLVPQRIEFWQGRRSRFHDRIVFVRQADGSWIVERLQP